MKTADLDYDLPEELIAQHPATPRDAARLMVVDRESGRITLDEYRNVAGYLRAGDCMVVNDTRVIRARVYAKKASGGRIELFLLRELAPGSWEALVRPSARVRPGTAVHLAGGLSAIVDEILPDGRRRVTFDRPDVVALLEEVGEIPLPPYIHRTAREPGDVERYQTVYAAHPGAVAAPTAGLHFTPRVFESLDRAGIRRVSLTLHVGYGTFKPILAEDLAAHTVDPEWFSFSAAAAQQLNETRARGGRVAAVGTTSTRVLETQFSGGHFHAGEGETAHYIHPPYTFRAVDVLQTNFHLPRSSLLALVFAFAGRDLMLEAYARAVRERFRFYSYGDVMLIR